MKNYLLLLYLLVNFSALSQSSTLILPNGNSGLFSKNNTTIISNTGIVQPPVSGIGTRLMWIPAKSAFRVGTVDGAHWNADSIGTWSVAMGYNTVAGGDYSVALGAYNTAKGSVSIVWGSNNTADGLNATAMGYLNKAGGTISTVWGEGNSASGTYSTGWGNKNIAYGENSTVFGVQNTANGSGATAWGYFNNAIGSYSSAWGANTTAGGEASTAFGLFASAGGDFSTAFGESASAQAYASTVMGRYNIVAGTANSWVSTDPLFVIGNGVAENTRNNAVTVLKNGSVGIGTPTPDAPLHIMGNGASTGTVQRAYFTSSTGTALVTGTAITSGIKVHADGYFWADGGGFVATSDARIKQIIGQSKSENDLQTLRKITITDYNYIDQINNGSTPHKKVIAQQVKEIFPQAVNQNKGVIPSVYQTAQSVSITGNTTKVVTAKAHALITGDMVKLILENGGEKLLEVIVIDNHTFTVDQVLPSKVFVYGKQVNDLHNVDYDALSMLNVSATQELAKQVELLKKENEALKAKNEKLESKVDKLDVQLTILKDLILKVGQEKESRHVSQTEK